MLLNNGYVLKYVLNNGLVLKKVHKVIKFNQNFWLKPYIGINIDLRKKAKDDFEKYFYKLRKHRDIKLVTTETRRNYLESEPNDHTKFFFHRSSISIRNEETEILMNKPIYLGLSVL